MASHERRVAPRPAVELERTLDGRLGVELTQLSADRAEASFEVADRHRQRFGLIHGGTYAAIAEFLATEGTIHGVAERGNLAVGSSNHTSFLRPVSAGVVRATGRPRHRGGTTWVWEVDFQDERERLCAVSRVTVAVRPAPEGLVEPIGAPLVIR